MKGVNSYFVKQGRNLEREATKVVIQETEEEIPGSVEHPGIHYFCIVSSSWYCTRIGAGLGTRVRQERFILMLTNLILFYQKRTRHFTNNEQNFESIHFFPNTASDFYHYCLQPLDRYGQNIPLGFGNPCVNPVRITNKSTLLIGLLGTR